jgi:hypothetical protein
VLIDVLRRVLAPVVRLMLAKGITLPMAIELLKRIFVEVAQRDLATDGKGATDSRISLLTGVHRKDVRRFRELPQLDTELPEKVSLGAQVIARWTTHADWLDADGHAKALPRLGKNGAEASFDALVSSISRDIRPRSVLDEWLRLGVVSVNDDDEVVLREEAFIPQQGSEEKLAYFGLNLGDHAAAATDNLLVPGQAWFERSVHHEGLSEAHVATIRERASEHGMKLLKDLHRQAENPASADEKGGGRRFTCGVYFYSTDDQPGKIEG